MTARDDALRALADAVGEALLSDEFAEYVLAAVDAALPEYRATAVNQAAGRFVNADHKVRAAIASTSRGRTFTADEVIQIANETSDSFGNLYRLDFIDRIRREAVLDATAETTGEGEHRCPYPAGGCTNPDCHITKGRTEQRAYERGHRDGYDKGLAARPAVAEGTGARPEAVVKAEALLAAADDALTMYDPPVHECIEWSEWLRARAERILGDRGVGGGA